jgi:hypothetical protein
MVYITRVDIVLFPSTQLMNFGIPIVEIIITMPSGYYHQRSLRNEQVKASEIE